MSYISKILITILISGSVYFYVKVKEIPSIPTLEEKWWASGSPQKEDTTIRPFKINISDEVNTYFF